MEKYDLKSDPCDYRIIRINNCLQVLACVCNILAIFIGQLREIAKIINYLADIFYHCVSGCMTAQVAWEVDYQNSVGNFDGQKNGGQPVTSGGEVVGTPIANAEPEYAPNPAADPAAQKANM